MIADLDGPVDVTVRSRASTAGSTGLDYSSCHRVDEDIISRIRALILSRHDHCPPITPHNSDEHGGPANFLTAFDFGSAKSIAKLAREDTGQLSVPDNRRRHRSTSPIMEERRDTQITLPNIILPTSTLRNVTSADNVKAVIGPLTDPTPAGSKKKFGLPKLILQDKKKPDFEVKSCIEISRRIPSNDAQIHEDELACCPPCDPRDTQPSKYIVNHPDQAGRALKVEPADLACFLASCPPGRANCEKHQRRRRSIQFRESVFNNVTVPEDFRSVAEGLKRDVAKLGLTLQGVPVKLPQVVDSQDPTSTTQERIDLRLDTPKGLAPSKDTTMVRSRKNTKSPISISPTSPVSSGSMDAFPLAAHYMELAAAESQPRFSTTVATNFSLPGYKKKGNPKRASVILRTKLSESSLAYEDQTTHPQSIDEIAFIRAGGGTFSPTVVPESVENRPGLRRSKSKPEDEAFSTDSGIPSGAEVRSGINFDAADMPGHLTSMNPIPTSITDSSTQDAEISSRPSDVSLSSTKPLVSESIHNKVSKASLKTKSYTPSLLSGASRTSSTRHALLKPSVTEAQPVDTGLPVPPILMPVPVEAVVQKRLSPEIIKEEQDVSGPLPMGSEPTNNVVAFLASGAEDQKSSAPTKDVTEPVLPSPAVDHLTNLQKARELVDSVRGQIRQVEEEMLKAMVEQSVKSPPIQQTGGPRDVNVSKKTSKPEKISAISSPKSHRLGDCVSSTEEKCPDLFTTIPHPMDSTSSQDPSKVDAVRKESLKATEADNAAYWGFVPAVKDAVQDAVELAVRNAVQDIVVPKDTARDEASEAYRKLMADTLAQVAQRADEYMRKASLWNNPSSTLRDSEGTVIFTSRPTKPTSVTTVPASDPTNQAKQDGVQQSRRQSTTKNQENEATPTADKAAGTTVSPTSSKYGQIGDNPDNFEAREDLTVLLGVTSPGELETIPLENEDTFDTRNDRPGWRLSKAFKKGYTPIPTRQSSKNRVLSPKTSATNSISKFSPKGTVDSPIRKRSFERLLSKAGRGLRSISSAGSLRSAGSDKNDQGEKLLPSKPITPPKGNSKPDASLPGPRKLSRKNTVHWLRELLSSNGPYETRFTALPPRTRRDCEALGKPPRSQTAPMAPISDLYLGKTPEPTFPKPVASRGKRGQRFDPSETFSKTINDLENLMNEALLIARQAADSQDPMFAPTLLGSAVQMLKGGRKETDTQLKARLEAERRQSRIAALQCSEDSSDASVHESLLSYSEYSESDLEDEEKLREPPRPSVKVAPINSQTRHASGWPPTGRASTPFPPSSMSDSRNSPVRHPVAVTGKDLSLAVADRLHSADPRSMPLETDVEEIRRRSSVPAMANVSVPRKVSVFRSPDPQGNSSNEHSPSSMVTPAFRTLEPFRGSSSTKVEESRKSSAKSPRRLSPTRKSKTEGVATNPAALESEDVVLDLCGDPKPRGNTMPLPKPTPYGGSSLQNPTDVHTLEQHQSVASKLASKSVPSKQEVRDYILQRKQPPITPRSSSLALRQQAEEHQANTKAKSGQTGHTGKTYDWQNIDVSKMRTEFVHPGPETRATTSGTDLIERFMDRDRHGYSHSLDGSLADHSEVLDFEAGYGVRQRSGVQAGGSRPLQPIELQDNAEPNLPQTRMPENIDGKKKHHFSLGGKRHLSLRSQHLKGFSFTRSHKRQAIARDWSPTRKRFAASVSCLSTALVGILVGIYAGETPAIQYYIVDFHHYTVLGNVFFFVGLAIPTFLFWPLPLLHGRKPYILGSMSLAMPLLFPQALAVGQFRSPYVAIWRIGLILPRALMGFCLGFANMNFKAMLTDLFGASLQSQNPHQEHVDEFDVRRHGGGMGAWLGLWTWCSVGSIGFGFMIGALIINTLPPAWGFYVSIAIIAFVMLLNVICPEVRRSAFRRSVAEVVKENAVSRRLARGEVKMHMVQSGPKWWGEELLYGIMLSKKMLRQPGFLIMALYNAWIYGQMVLIISLLGALLSRDYKLKSPLIGAGVMSLPIGALLAIPFQKASYFSRARNVVVTSDDATLKKKFAWSSHMLRRSIFVLCLPLAGLAYTLSSGGQPTPLALPIIFAGIIGFFSSLALAECSGIIMETFDTSDLQPGMTGRPRGSSGDKTASKRTNYSSFPRVQSAFAMCSGFGYLIAAAAAGVGGSLTRHLGQQAATGIMAGILLILSLLLLATLIRFTNIQIIPDSKKDEMERYHQARRASAVRREEGVEEEEPWRPIIIGNPHHVTRRMCLLELGSMSRFSEIRRKNKLIDERSLEAQHPNRAAIEDVREYMQHKEHELRHKVSQSLSRNGSRKSRQSNMSAGPEQGDLGGHREMLKRGGSGNGSGRGAPGSARKGTSMARKGIKEQERE